VSRSSRAKRTALRTRHPPLVRLAACAQSLRDIGRGSVDLQQTTRNRLHGIADTIEHIIRAMEPPPAVRWTGAAPPATVTPPDHP
jgi:hypothetical protein